MSNALVLIYGESSNDTKSIRHLVAALLPQNVAVDCKPIREPGTLSHKTSPAKRKKIAAAIAIKAAHESKKRKVIVVAHEDMDECENAHKEHSLMMTAELKKAGISLPVAAVAAWELETWWMLFPEALQAYRACWRLVDYSRRRVGLIENAKEVLTRDLRPTGQQRNRCPDYAESDSEQIAEEVSNLRLCDDGRFRKSASLSDFRDQLVAAVI